MNKQEQNTVEIRHRITSDIICSGASLRDAIENNGADLSGADLSGADLSGSYLRGADLRGAKIEWNSHDMLSEILRRDAGEDIEKLKLAGLILICRNRCWDWFVGLDDPLSGWAVEVLSRYIVDGDDHPAELDQFIKKAEAVK